MLNDSRNNIRSNMKRYCSCSKTMLVYNSAKLLESPTQIYFQCSMQLRIHWIISVFRGPILSSHSQAHQNNLSEWPSLESIQWHDLEVWDMAPPYNILLLYPATCTCRLLMLTAVSMWYHYVESPIRLYIHSQWCSEGRAWPGTWPAKAPCI